MSFNSTNSYQQLNINFKSYFHWFVAIYIVFIPSTYLFSQPLPVNNTLYISGKNLMTPCGDTIILHGVNNMNGWKAGENLLLQDFSEIKKTGSNCVRIVWQADPGFGTSVSDFDIVLQSCIENGLIPIPELHDATSTWSKLSSLVDWWTSSEVVTVLKKHEKYMILNIGNEVGDGDVTDDDYIKGYTNAIQRIRAQGIICPLLIDAAGYGQGFSYISNNAASIINSDPLKNIMFSIHLYYEEYSKQDRDALVSAGLQDLIAKEIPFIVGEFSGGTLASPQPNQPIDLYKTIIPICQTNHVGYIAWEWHPGNNYNDIDITLMDMTSDGKYINLKTGWAKDIMVNDQNSIKNTTKTPDYIINKGICSPNSIENKSAVTDNNLFPNPAINFINFYDANISGIICIDLINSSGIKIKNLYTGGYNHENLTFDLANLTAGLYFLKINQNSAYKIMTFLLY